MTFLSLSEVSTSASAAATSTHIRKHLTVADADAEIAIMIQSVGPTNSSRFYSVTYYVVSPLHAGNEIEKVIKNLDGTVVQDFNPTIVPPEAEGMVGFGTLWYGPAGERWPAEAMLVVEVTVTAGTHNTVSKARMPVGLNAIPLVGPLERADTASDGSVLLTGSFAAPPLVVAPNSKGLKPLPVEGTYFIPVSAGLLGEVVVVVSSKISPGEWECSTRVVYVGTPDMFR